ncbi:MAG: hypothetical protein AB7I50_13340 [Vicinamibacterales bacterium]
MLVSPRAWLQRLGRVLSALGLNSVTVLVMVLAHMFERALNHMP